MNLYNYYIISFINSIGNTDIKVLTQNLQELGMDIEKEQVRSRVRTEESWYNQFLKGAPCKMETKDDDDYVDITDHSNQEEEDIIFEGVV